MNISPIGMSTPTNNNLSFNGNIILSGSGWDNAIIKKINKLESSRLDSLLDGHDLVFRQVSKTIKNKSSYYFKGTEVRKIVASRVKENSLLAKVADMLHLIPRKDFTNDYHSSYDLEDVFDKRHLNGLACKFGLIKQ